MKSVGEVMAIGRTFEEVVQKAVRMCDIGKDGLVSNANLLPQPTAEDIERIELALIHPTDEIIFAVVESIKAGLTIARINQLSGIDPWFLLKIKNIVDMEDNILHKSNSFDDS